MAKHYVDQYREHTGMRLAEVTTVTRKLARKHHMYNRAIVYLKKKQKFL